MPMALEGSHMSSVKSWKTYLKPHERFFILNYQFHLIDCCPGRKGGTAVAVRKGNLDNHVDLPPLVSVEVTGVYSSIGNNEIPLAAVYKSPGRTWRYEDIIELLRFRNKCILAGDLNAKHLFWNSVVSNPSGGTLLQLFDINELEITAPQCPTHYSPAVNGDMLDTVVLKNIIKLSCHCLWHSGLRSLTNSISHLGWR
jgi:hypothetical protein